MNSLDETAEQRRKIAAAIRDAYHHVVRGRNLAVNHRLLQLVKVSPADPDREPFGEKHDAYNLTILVPGEASHYTLHLTADDIDQFTEEALAKTVGDWVERCI